MDMRDDPLERKRLGRIAGSPLIEPAEDRAIIPIPLTKLLEALRQMITSTAHKSILFPRS